MKQALIFVLIIAILLANASIAFASDYVEFEDDNYSPYVSSLDIRSSIILLNKYKLDQDTQLYHVVAGKSFSVKDIDALARSDIEAYIQIKKGDTILVFDVPELQGTDKVAMIVSSGYIVETDRSNLKTDKKGVLIKSAPIEVENSLLTNVSRKIPGRGKYIYENPDIKSKKIGVIGKGTVFATYKDAYYEKLPQIFLSLQLPGDRIGYMYLGDERNPTSFSMGRFTNES